MTHHDHDPTGSVRDQDPDKEPTSRAGAASRQAAEADQKQQAEGGQPEPPYEVLTNHN